MIIRRWLPFLLVAAMLLPFLFVTIPPLTDAPGHLAQFAIPAAPADSPLHRYYDFHWALRLNLGTDLLVEGLRHLIGLHAAFWLVTAAIPCLTALAILALARVATRLAGAGTSWALCFCYGGAFLYGLLNYELAMALALLAFAGWIALEERRGLREALAWAVIPALMIAHAIGGALLPAMIFARELAKTDRTLGCIDIQLDPPLQGEVASRSADGGVSPSRERDTPPPPASPAVPLPLQGRIPLPPTECRRGLGRRLVALRPLLALLPAVILWKLTGSGGGLAIHYDLGGKATAIVTALRDQNRPLDIASILAVLAVPIAGRLLGARYTRENAAVVAIVGLLFLATPNQLNGSFAADMRLIPPLIVLLLALQDWSAVQPDWRRGIAIAGGVLVTLRLAITTVSFIGYAASYRAETAALPHIAPGTRVLAFVDHPCRASRSWRGARLDHLPALATVERGAWTNAMWDVGDIHLLHIAYRPSPLFTDDPSQYVWPADCLDTIAPTTEEERRTARRTIDQAMPLLPLDGIDYLWLVRAKLPVGSWATRLTPVWSNGASTLYRVSAAGGSSPH